MGRPFVGGDVPDAGALSINALSPSGKLSTTRVRRLISLSGRSIMLLALILLRCSWEPVQQVGGRLPDSLPQAVRGGLQPPGLHLRGDLLGLGEGGFPGFHLETLLASPVAFDDRGLEDRALELGHLQSEPAGLGGQSPFVMAGAVRLPLPGTLVSGGVGDLVGLKRRALRSIVR